MWQTTKWCQHWQTLNTHWILQQNAIDRQTFSENSTRRKKLVFHQVAFITVTFDALTVKTATLRDTKEYAVVITYQNSQIIINNASILTLFKNSFVGRKLIKNLKIRKCFSWWKNSAWLIFSVKLESNKKPVVVVYSNKCNCNHKEVCAILIRSSIIVHQEKYFWRQSTRKTCRILYFSNSWYNLDTCTFKIGRPLEKSRLECEKLMWKSTKFVHYYAIFFPSVSDMLGHPVLIEIQLERISL